MCKTYEAIYEVKKLTNSDNIVLWIDGARIKGELSYCVCNEGCDGGKCIDGIITLTNAKIECKDCGKVREFEWLNVVSEHIKAFSFEPNEI